MAQYVKNLSCLCRRGCDVVGDLSHILWDCPKVQQFGGNVKRQISKTFNLKRLIEPQQLILGIVLTLDLGTNTVYNHSGCFY